MLIKCCLNVKQHFLVVLFTILYYNNVVKISREEVISITDIILQEQVFNEYEYIVYACYKKLYKDEFILDNREDILQEGFLGLWKGVLSYNESTEMKIFSYLYLCVRNTMFSWIRKNKPYYSYNDVYEEGYETPVDFYDSLFDIFPQDDETTISIILKIYKQWMLQTKHTLEVKIIKRLARANMILSEVAKHDKVSCRSLEEYCAINRDTISRILKEIKSAIELYQKGKLII